MPEGRSTEMGHAQGYLREELCERIVKGQTVSRKLIGQLWNCTDCLPSGCCEDLEIPYGSTYAVGVRKMKAEGYWLRRTAKETIRV